LVKTSLNVDKQVSLYLLSEWWRIWLPCGQSFCLCLRTCAVWGGFVEHL